MVAMPGCSRFFALSLCTCCLKVQPFTSTESISCADMPLQLSAMALVTIATSGGGFDALFGCFFAPSSASKLASSRDRRFGAMLASGVAVCCALPGKAPVHCAQLEPKRLQRQRDQCKEAAEGSMQGWLQRERDQCRRLQCRGYSDRGINAGGYSDKLQVLV